MMPTNKSQRPREAANVMTDDHSELGRLIDDLLAALDEGNKALSFERLDLLWARLAVHIRAEHLCLFPSILGAPRANFTGTGGTPWYEEAQRAIDVLRHDHDFFMRELSTAVNAMRKHGTVADPVGTRGLLQEVRRCVVSVETRLQTHNQFEEEQVYTWVDALLGEAERSALTVSMRHELENIPPRFQQV
jgi:hypothetical protein